MVDLSSISVPVTPDSAGIRLDSYLARQIGTISRSRVKALILSGACTKSGVVTTDPAEIIHPGATYCLTLPSATPAIPQAQPLPLDVLYEDKAILVVNKAAGMVVHPAPGNPDGTLVNALIAHCGEGLTGIGGERRPGIVHRLDKDTSGVMVVAKTEQAMVRLSAAFAARDLDREYKALCWGLPMPHAGRIEGDIGRDPKDRKRMAVVQRNGKYAVTNYHLLRHHETAVSLISCKLETGRTHQIRVHMAHIGHPLIGDPIYLRRRPAAAKLLSAPAREAALDFSRQALHAQTLRLAHPITGQNLHFQVEPPEDFINLLNLLMAD